MVYAVTFVFDVYFHVAMTFVIELCLLHIYNLW